jgi:serine protease Do
MTKTTKEYLKTSIVALISALFAVVLYRWVDGPRRIVWQNDGGETRYTHLVDRLFEERSKAGFKPSAPTEFTLAAEVTTPTVVNIKALLKVSDDLFGDDKLTGSSGSGVIVSPDGYIVTNHHVVERGVEIKITLADKREYKARLVGSDPFTDVALLKINGTDLPFAVFGDSDSVRVGEWVLAVGNPFNLTSTVTAGIVSAKGRNINILGGGASIESFIQTDAAVNPGNSGGALVNATGELIGINTAIITESGNYEGYSFAVPSNLVQKVVRDLREFGAVQRAYLGIGIEDLDVENASDVGLPNAQGVYVTRISSYGAADAAGLQVGDVILSINNTLTRTTPELQEIIGRYRPGESVTLEYWRNNSRYRTKITLKDKNNSSTIARYQGDELRESIGLELRSLTSDEQRRSGLTGAVVNSVKRGSLVAATNMQPGFLLTRVNGSRVTTLNEAIETIQNAYNSLVLDGYYPGEEDLYSYRFKKRGG